MGVSIDAPANCQVGQGGMNMSRKDELVVGLDIGTTKICAVVAEETENGVDIVGIGTHPSRGLRKGAKGWSSTSTPRSIRSNGRSRKPN